MRIVVSALIIALLIASGCLGDPANPEPSPTTAPPEAISPPVILVEATNELLFAKKTIATAVGVALDLNEPTIEVSDKGVLYVAGHVIAAITTGTPAYYSKDDGATWQPLPFAAHLQTPPPGQGSAPPPGDEGFIVAGDNGQAWMTDITLAAYPVNGWCDNGARQCYHNPNAYDRAQATTTTCRAGSLNDRPWAAYANGTLLMVNNPGGGPVQIGVLKVPPPQPVGAGGGQWNLCASTGGGIPGVPGMRRDGFFAVPQIVTGSQGKLHVVLGNVGDINRVRQADAFALTHRSSGVPNFAGASFDRDGNLYVVAANNTGAGQQTPGQGQLRVAVSSDDGETFETRSFNVGRPVRFYFLDGNAWGPGALLTWSVPGEGSVTGLGGSTVDEWYAGHLHVDANGAPTLSNVSMVGKTRDSIGDVMGSALGPDGRAYLVTHEGGFVAPNSRPLSVWVQEKGTPALPVLRPT